MRREDLCLELKQAFPGFRETSGSGVRKEHSSFWDVLEAMVKYNITVGDSVVFLWSFPNGFLFLFQTTRYGQQRVP